MLAGSEFVWLRDPLVRCTSSKSTAQPRLTHDRFSARRFHIGFAGSNGLPYTSVGKMLVEDEKIDKNHSEPADVAVLLPRQHPEDLAKYTQRNDRYVFFQNYGPDVWPAGSLGLKVTPFRSLATDKSIFPRGCLALSQTRRYPAGRELDEMRLFNQFMLDQDAGVGRSGRAGGAIFTWASAPARNCSPGGSSPRAGFIISFSSPNASRRGRRSSAGHAAAIPYNPGQGRGYMSPFPV